MRMPAAFILVTLPATASAHPGHLVEAAGHTHWVAGAAIGIAVLVGLWGAIAGGIRKDEDAQADPARDEDAAA